VVALGIAGLLLWLVFRQIDIEDMLSRLKDVNYLFVGLSMVLMLVAHWVRSYRWSLMLVPMGYKISTVRIFNAILVGYIANLFLPRMGEITRCGVLKRTDNVQISVSFGTVVAERIVDVITLFSLVFINFILEYQLLKTFFLDLFNTKLSAISKNLYAFYLIAGIVFVLLIISFLLLRTYKEKLKQYPLYLKIRNILKEIVKGMLSIRKIKNKTGFWVSTVIMWSLYYLLSYVIFYSVEETSGLPLIAGFTVLVTGSIGMATPVQGGIGAVHILISSVLVLYGIVLSDGLLFATVLHSSQMIGTIFFGGISLIVTVLLQRKKIKSEVPANKV
jgi:glycosyltransferase 2 family protein